MRARSWMLLVLSPVTIGGCAAARAEPSPEAAPAEAHAAAPAPTPPSTSVATAAPTTSAPTAEVPHAAPTGSSPVDVPLERGQLPIVCEAYFAQFRNCIAATMRKHPDENTREAVRRQFEKAEQTSRAQMSAGMDPKDAETFCKQALVALTVSPCE